MPTPRHDTPDASTTDSLWLEVQLNDERWLFELRADDDAAITVGSHPSAEIQISSPGVAATHFHFEREGSELVAVPGYRAGLRVNSIKAPGPTRMSEHATIDFFAVSLQVNVHRTPPENFRGRVRRRSSTPAEYLRALPGERDVTGIALGPAPTLPTFSSFDTVEAVAPRLRTSGLVPLGAAPLPGVSLGLGPQGTVIMRAVRPDLAPSPAPQMAPEPLAMTFDPSRTERIPIVKNIAASTEQLASPDSTPTRAEVPALRRSSAPPPSTSSPTGLAPGIPSTPHALAMPIPIEPSASVAPVIPVRALLPEPATSMKTADFDVAAMAPFFVTPASGLASPPVLAPVPYAPPPSEPVPTATTIPAPRAPSPPLASRAPAWLVALGRWAQQRPLPVTAAALGGSLVLALALVGAARLASDTQAGAHQKRSNGRTTLPASSVAARSAESQVATTPAPAPAASVASPRADPKQLLEATTHLTSGRYAEAEVLYRTLASAQPTSPAYAGIADILERSRSPHCRQKPPASDCPEVIP